MSVLDSVPSVAEHLVSKPNVSQAGGVRQPLPTSTPGRPRGVGRHRLVFLLRVPSRLQCSTSGWMNFNDHVAPYLLFLLSDVFQPAEDHPRVPGSLASYGALEDAHARGSSCARVLVREHPRA